MSIRRVCAVVLFFGLVVLASHREVFAQGGGVPGTVTWNAGFPKANNAVPPNPMGSVDVQGTYTVNQGFNPIAGSFTYSLASGGVLQGKQLDMLNGQMGKNVNGAIVPYNLALAKGTYQGTLVVTYGPNNPPDVVVSTTVQFTIN